MFAASGVNVVVSPRPHLAVRPVAGHILSRRTSAWSTATANRRSCRRTTVNSRSASTRSAPGQCVFGAQRRLARLAIRTDTRFMGETWFSAAEACVGR